MTDLDATRILARELRQAAFRCGYAVPDGLAQRINRPADFVERLLAGCVEVIDVDETLIDDLAAALTPSGTQRPSKQPLVRAIRWCELVGLPAAADLRRAKLRGPIL